MPADFPPSPLFSIQTERLHISYIQAGNPEHCKFLVEIYNTDQFIQSCGQSGIDTIEKADEFIKSHIQEDYNRNKYGRFLVSLKPYQNASLTESKMIGLVSLMKVEGVYTCPDIGYAILPEENNKGYATEAALGLLNYARNNFDVMEVFGFCGYDNARSRHVLEKLGLEFRGERNLRAFGGAHSAVYATPGIDSDLKLYGIDD